MSRVFFEKHMPVGLKVVGPNCFIEGLRNEFDLLVVCENAHPKEDTSAYPPDLARTVVEVKLRGIFNREDPQKYRRIFDQVRAAYPHVDCLYLTVSEVARTKRKGSYNFAEEMRKGLGPYESFTLRDSRSGKIVDGAWESFVKCVIV